MATIDPSTVHSFVYKSDEDYGYSVRNYEEWSRSLTAGSMRFVDEVPELGVFWYSGIGSLEEEDGIWSYVIEFD